MILWTFISGSLFYGAFMTRKHTTRRTCNMLLVGWLIFSFALHAIGGPAID